MAGEPPAAPKTERRQTTMRNRTHYSLVASLVVLALAVISIGPYRTYPGSAASFLAFDASFLLMVVLALPRPRIYTYTFLAAFLFLGFWVKFMAHMWVTYPFVEAIGKFGGSSSEWSE